MRIYCSGFESENSFGHGLDKIFLNELKEYKSIVYIPGGEAKIEKSINKYIPSFHNHFKKIGITFENEILITPDMGVEKAKNAIDNADFIFLMGGDPFKQKKICEDLNIIENLKNYKGLMVGFSAGAMFMSKYIIITPCSEEYPDFQIEEGLNLDDISIYPHNNIDDDKYPDILVAGDEKYAKDDLIKVANEYGEFYLLQDYLREDGLKNISAIVCDKNIKKYTEYNGRIWKATKGDIVLIKNLDL